MAVLMLFVLTLRGANGHCMISCPRRIGRCYPDTYVAGYLNSTYVGTGWDGLKQRKVGDTTTAGTLVSCLMHTLPIKPILAGENGLESCLEDAPKGACPQSSCCFAVVRRARPTGTSEILVMLPSFAATVNSLVSEWPAWLKLGVSPLTSSPRRPPEAEVSMGSS